jgi:hypothetical protein
MRFVKAAKGRDASSCASETSVTAFVRVRLRFPEWETRFPQSILSVLSHTITTQPFGR